MVFTHVLKWLFGSFLAASLIAVISFFLWIFIRKRRAKKLLGTDLCYHIEGYPLLGYLPLLAKVKNVYDLYVFLVDAVLSMNYPVLSLWVLHKHWVAVTDPDMAEKVVTNPEAIDKSEEYDVFDLVSKGVFIEKKEKWMKLRRAVNKTFTSKQLDFYVDTNVELSKIACKVYGDTEGYVNVHPYVSRFFLDLILRTHFGLYTNEQEENKYNSLEPMTKMLDVAFGLRVVHPFLIYNFIFKLTKYYAPTMAAAKEFYRPIEESAKLLYPAWLERKQKNGGVPVNFTLMDHYFQLVDEFGMKQSLDTYNVLVSDIIVAGTDTTGYATSALIYFVALYEDVQNKILNEVLEHWPSNGDLTKECLSKMVYLEMCMNEAVRIVAPPGILRSLRQDLDLGNGCVIPKGSRTYVAIQRLHTDPKYWQKPKEFYPEHFLPESVAARPKMSYIPFSGGARRCPGIQYGLQAMKTLLAYLVKEYHLETNLPFEKVEFQIHFMKEFVQGYPVKFTKRNNVFT